MVSTVNTKIWHSTLGSMNIYKIKSGFILSFVQVAKINCSHGAAQCRSVPLYARQHHGYGAFCYINHMLMPHACTEAPV